MRTYPFEMTLTLKPQARFDVIDTVLARWCGACIKAPF